MACPGCLLVAVAPMANNASKQAIDERDRCGNVSRVRRSMAPALSKLAPVATVVLAISTFLSCATISSAFLVPDGGGLTTRAREVSRIIPIVPRGRRNGPGPAPCNLIKYGNNLVPASDGPVHTLLDNAGSIMTQKSGSGMLPRKGFLVGSISTALRNLVSLARPALARLLDVVDPLDLAFLLSLAFGSEMILRGFNNRVMNKTVRKNDPKIYDQSKLSFLGKFICQFGQCSLAGYLCEIFIAFLDAVGLHLPPSAPRTVAISIYIIWAAKNLCTFKRRLLRQYFARIDVRKLAGGTTKAASKGVFLDRVADALVYFLSGIVILDMCSVQVGVVVSSVLSLAGLSSVILGLALRDPATQIMQGTSLLLLDRFGPGDKIQLADGTVGRVKDIGWLDTTIKGSDDISARIPNSEIASRRIYNISRTKRSQVKQKLRFKYTDIDKLPTVIKDIKSELIESCPKLVTDGSSTFRVTWTDYSDDHISVVVNTHHNMTPKTNEYHDTVQLVMMAIARAVKKNGVQFALPSRIHLKPT